MLWLKGLKLGWLTHHGKVFSPTKAALKQGRQKPSTLLVSSSLSAGLFLRLFVDPAISRGNESPSFLGISLRSKETSPRSPRALLHLKSQIMLGKKLLKLSG
jgi:hypothetical protein